jgi:asparagine synthase (glutamine-hydrolysing)
MRGRYIILWAPAAAPSPLLSAAFDQVVRLHNLVRVDAGAGLMVAAGRDMPPPRRAGGGSAVILGQIFGPAGSNPAPRDEEEPEAFTRRFWGAYLAVRAPRPGRAGFAFRDPSGLFPCYRIAHPDAEILVSDAALARDAGLLDGAVDWGGLVQGLAYPNLRLAQTALAGCTELLPGTAISMGAEGRDRLPWNPAAFASARASVGSADPAALKQVIQECVAAWAGAHRHILLELSGGLDSSIVAACLKAAGANFTCVTLATASPEGDERIYARAVADFLNVPLAERAHDPGAVAFERSSAAHLPRPSGRAFAQASEGALLEVADAVGADAFMSGGGGDNVFCYLASAGPAADRLLFHGPGLGFMKTVRDITDLRGVTLREAAMAALRIALRRPTLRWRTDWTLLTPEARLLIGAQHAHPWLQDANTLLPGKRSHLNSLLSIHNHLEGFRRAACKPLLFPLLSQPIVEACLRIPTWRTVENGLDRSHARSAYAGLLPPLVLNRRSKGGLSGLAGALIRNQRKALCELLLDGRLAAAGIVDRPAIERLLDPGTPPAGVAFYRLFALADAEAWLRAW